MAILSSFTREGMTAVRDGDHWRSISLGGEGEEGKAWICVSGGAGEGVATRNDPGLGLFWGTAAA